MARAGRFGRLPRTAPSLTSTIVAILREMNAQEDQNMFDAWENGGEVDGKPVDDDRLLAHVKKRRDGFAKDDPMWDQWNQTLDNYTFSIAESKMSLLYAQGKVNDTRMAAFYKEWAGKVPTDSEAYRNLMRSAAQFLDAAKRRGGGGGGGGGGRSKKAGVPVEQVQGLYDQYERDYDFATQVILDVAYREGILQVLDTSDPDDVFDLRVGDEGDHARFLTIFDRINNDPAYAEHKQALLAEGIEAISYSSWLEMGDRRTIGLQRRIDLAYAYDDEDTAEDLTEELQAFTTLRAVNNDIDNLAAYQTLRQNFDRALSHPNLTPFQVESLVTGYRGALENVTRGLVFSEHIGMANNELAQLNGEDIIGPTLYEGNEGGIRSANDDAANRGAMVAEMNQMLDDIRSGRAYLFSTTDEAGNPTWDAIPVAQAQTVGLGGDPTGMVLWFNAGDRRPTPTYVQFRDILIQGTTGADPRTGRLQGTMAATGDQLIGRSYTLNGNTYYGIFRSDGSMQWFADDPFSVAERLRFTDDNGALVLNVPLTAEEIAAEDWDPYVVMNREALDLDLPNSARFNNPDEAFYLFDEAGRSALLNVSDREAALLIQRMYGDGEEGAEAYDNFREMRNTAVGLQNRQYDLVSLEASRFGGGAASIAARFARHRFGIRPVERTGENPVFDDPQFEADRTAVRERVEAAREVAGRLRRQRQPETPAQAAAMRRTPGEPTYYGGNRRGVLGEGPPGERDAPGRSVGGGFGAPGIKLPNLPGQYDVRADEPRRFIPKPKTVEPRFVTPLALNQRDPQQPQIGVPKTQAVTPKPVKPKPIAPKPYEYPSDPKETAKPTLSKPKFTGSRGGGGGGARSE